MKRRGTIYSLVAGLVLAAAGGQWLLAQAKAPAGHEITARGEVPPVERAKATVVAVKNAPPPHRGDGYRPSVDTGLVDYHGASAKVACMTCHTSKTPNPEAGAGGAIPKDFHQGLTYTHGGQTCLSCHNAGDYDTLRLADGRKLAFADAQMLCAQCHGQQTRDYRNGAHGGMNGYWDKSKGERTRNTCTDCHDPHAPAYPNWMPVFAPIDDGAKQQLAREAAHASPTLSHPE